LIKNIDGSLFAKMVTSAANNLSNYRNMVNDLNVFPVPDGDTGTNMSMTFSAASVALGALEDTNLSVVMKTISSAILRGARGNSGVILSQLFRGMAKFSGDNESLSIVEFAKAMEFGVGTAYKAVMKPTEGTILTVAREGMEKAVEIAGDSKDFIAFLQVVIGAAKESLDRTPDLLPVLREAGVVDAGGMGLVILYEGMLSALKGDKIEAQAGSELALPSSGVAATGVDIDITFAYCTEFIINKKNKNQSIARFSEYIASIGDSNLVIDDEDIVKVHVHTNHPGNAIEHALKLGELSSMKIDNMRFQHNEILVNSKQEQVPEGPPKEFGIVAVAAGDGIAETFKGLGVDIVVSGGQSMNPSTDDILLACHQVNAETIFILPNNKNIILAAEQAAEMSDKKIIVIPTKTMPQGFSAMFVIDDAEDAEGKETVMVEAIQNVTTGQVTYAARNSVFGGKEINEGDILGLMESDIKFVGRKADRVAAEIIESMIRDEGSSLITVFYGEEVKEKDAEKFSEKLRKMHPNCEILLYQGGQPLYHYIISAEK